MATAPKYPTYVPNKAKPAGPQSMQAPIDVSRNVKTLKDGRPAVISDWYDREAELTLRTVWYSSVGIENYKTKEHVKLLKDSGLYPAKTPDGPGEASSLVDGAGNAMWSFTVSLGEAQGG